MRLFISYFYFRDKDRQLLFCFPEKEGKALPSFHLLPFHRGPIFICQFISSSVRQFVSFISFIFIRQFVSFISSSASSVSFSFVSSSASSVHQLHQFISFIFICQFVSSSVSSVSFSFVSLSVRQFHQFISFISSSVSFSFVSSSVCQFVSSSVRLAPFFICQFVSSSENVKSPDADWLFPLMKHKGRHSHQHQGTVKKSLPHSAWRAGINYIFNTQKSDNSSSARSRERVLQR